MTTDIEKLDAKGYRKFGLNTGAIVLALFGIVIPWLFNLNYPKRPWILGGGLGAAGARDIKARLCRLDGIWSCHELDQHAPDPGYSFYAVFLPIGVVMRLFGKDPMHRKLDKTLAGYRVKSHHDLKDNVERPY